VPPTPGQPEKQPMCIPLAIGLIDGEGRDLPLDREGHTTRVLELREARETFRFANVPEAPVASLNRGFSAPVTLKQRLDRGARGFLMAHDGDPFNRWEAGQQYAIELLLGMAAAARDGRDAEIDEAFVAALRGTLVDDSLDKDFVALACHLPSELVLSEHMANADPDAIHEARETLRRAIAERLKGDLSATYYANRSNAPFSPDAEAAARRAVKNMALAYLGLLDDADCRDLARAQYDAADNMTDRMAALWTLNDRATADRARVLADFHDRFKDDPVVIDKWLSLEATSTLPGTLQRIAELMAHPAFSLTRPNRVRALIGGFAAGNPLRFHAADGSGYRFLVDRVIELDPINPQVAARLLTPLGRWRRYEAGRQAAMTTELRRVLATKPLSNDVYEIASKSLADSIGKRGG
jgi:aminopeptidase N